MKSWALTVPAVFTVPAWFCWFIFTIANMGEGTTEPPEARVWRTVYFISEMRLGIAATGLHPSKPGSPKE